MYFWIWRFETCQATWYTFTSLLYNLQHSKWFPFKQHNWKDWSFGILCSAIFLVKKFVALAVLPYLQFCVCVCPVLALVQNKWLLQQFLEVCLVLAPNSAVWGIWMWLLESLHPGRNLEEARNQHFTTTMLYDIIILAMPSWPVQNFFWCLQGKIQVVLHAEGGKQGKNRRFF